ncbi:hypothetical protein CTheo_5694 [Ceratobasidium theobromae]|uniref:Uncharacterized protein n=1 Tax=Ceratobasidium theobromae TaxID=1582974 RepID=A0A5N5QGX5_9AGAM|nr:hypothetical protein CTheo_5694 [Ceratobasidium theobromae]
MFEYTEAQGQRRPPVQRSYTSNAAPNYALTYPDGPSHSRSNSLDVNSGSWPAQWEQPQGSSSSTSNASWLVSPSNVFTHPRSAPPFDPISLDISSPPTPGSTATPAANPSQELEQLRRRARELELINQFATARVEELEKERALRQRSADGTPTMSPEFVADWESRTEARKRQYCSPNRAGNAPPLKTPDSKWYLQSVLGMTLDVNAAHTQREWPRQTVSKLNPTQRCADLNGIYFNFADGILSDPKNRIRYLIYREIYTHPDLNCGCTFNEALFEQALAAHGVGSYYPGESVRMDPALRTPLLKLLEWRYGYKDGDFDRDPATGQWINQPREEKKE